MGNKRYMTPVTEITPGFVRGKLTVIRPADDVEIDNHGTNQEFQTDGNKKWLCKCECGNEVLVYDQSLKRGVMVSCGCHKKAPDIIGHRFGRLTVMYQVTDSPDAKARWLCQCDCGNGAVMKMSGLKKSKVPSCGCYTREQSAIRATTHGLTDSPIHKVWSDMRERCNNPKNKSYPDYGGRGIKVDPRWEDFENFHNDMIGTYEPGLELDRIDNDGPYSPENCRWVTHLENCRNKRNTILVDSIYGMVTLGELAEKTGMKHLTLYNRKRSGIPDDLITIKNAASISDLKPLFWEDGLWITEDQEKRLYAAYDEINEEAREKVPHG